MEEEQRALSGTHTRVTFFLPANAEDPTTVRAVRRVVQYLQQQRGRNPLRESPVPVTGLTLSELLPAVFTGHWWSNRRRKWVEDSIVSFLIDYPARMGSEQLDQTLSLLYSASMRIRLGKSKKTFGSLLIKFFDTPKKGRHVTSALFAYARKPSGVSGTAIDSLSMLEITDLP
jgi:hypothetical protein